MPALIDSNVLLDIFTEDPVWFEWSSEMLSKVSEQGLIFINPIIYAEISHGFDRIEVLEDALPSSFIQRDDLPYEAAFLAAKCYLRYKKSGGTN